MFSLRKLNEDEVAALVLVSEFGGVVIVIVSLLLDFEESLIHHWLLWQ